MKKIACASLLALFVATSSNAIVPNCIKSSIKDNYIALSAGTAATVGLTSVLIYDIVKNDKKMLKAARDLAKKLYKNTFEKHPVLATSMVLASLVASGASWDILLRKDKSFLKGKYNYIASLFEKKAGNNKKSSKK